MNTILLPYALKDPRDREVILAFIQNQNNVVRFAYNRLQENPELKQKELMALVNATMNNIFVDSFLKQSAVCKAKSLQGDRIIFGGKKLFLQRNKSKISVKEFRAKRLFPLYIVGQSNCKGNRKVDFRIMESNSIVFKPEHGVKIEMIFPKLKKNYRKTLFCLQQLMEGRKTPVTIQIDMERVYITYDEKALREESAYKVKNRIMSIDENPNYTGYCIKDWIDNEHFTIVKSGYFSIKKLNDREFNIKDTDSSDPKKAHVRNKRIHEVFEISKRLVNIARSHNVSCFAMEDLSMKSKDKGNGKWYNRLVNNLWNRNRLESNLEKRLGLCGIPLHRMYPEYSSFIGNLVYDYVDCVNAAMEINRRCFCYTNKIKPVVFPDFIASIKRVRQSLEELPGGRNIFVDGMSSWKELYRRVKKSGLRYRLSLEGCKKPFRVLRFFDRKSLIEEIQFI